MCLKFLKYFCRNPTWLGQLHPEIWQLRLHENAAVLEEHIFNNNIKLVKQNFSYSRKAFSHNQNEP